MDNTDGTSQETGSGGLTEHQAAERFAQMLSGDGDSDAGETGDEESQAEDVDADGEPEAEADEDQSDDESEADDGDRQELDDQTPIRVKAGEEEIEVTLHELKRGFLREQDYTRKTMALSEQAKAMLAERQAEQAQFAPLAAKTQAIIEQLEQSLRTPLYSEQDMAELRYTNPAEWSARRAEMDEHTRWVEGILAHKDTLNTFQQQQQQRASEAEIRAAREATNEAILKARPEWADPAKAEADLKLVHEYAVNLGLTQEEFADLALDHRSILALHDAAQWRALKAKTPKVQAKLQSVKTAAPGTKSQAPSKVTDVTRARQRLAKTGREADAAAVFMKLLPD